MNGNKRNETCIARRILGYAALTAFVVAGNSYVQGLTDIAAAARTFQGRVDGVPIFKVDSSWPKIPAKWKLGDVSSVAVDARNHIWVLHRYRTLPAEDAAMAAPPVIVFDDAGNFIKAWGGPAEGYQWPEREHGISIDYKGFVWIGGNNCPERNLPGLKPLGDDQLLKFTQDGRFVMQLGHSNASTGNFDTKNLRQPADVFVYKKTNEAFVADGYGNHRVAVFDADTGAFKRMWGAFGSKPVDAYKCPPDLVSAPHVEAPGPQQFSTVHAVRVSDDGFVYVADRENKRVQVFTLEGKFVNQILQGDRPFARDLAFSPDSQQRFLYVGAGTQIAVVDRKSLKIVEFIEGGGEKGGGHEMTADAKGNLYVAMTTGGLKKLTFMGMAPPSK